MRKQATWTAALLFTSVIGMGVSACQQDSTPTTPAQPSPPAGQQPSDGAAPGGGMPPAGGASPGETEPGGANR